MRPAIVLAFVVVLAATSLQSGCSAPQENLEEVNERAKDRKQHEEKRKSGELPDVDRTGR
jgi:hypothetical protein